MWIANIQDVFFVRIYALIEWTIIWIGNQIIRMHLKTGVMYRVRVQVWNSYIEAHSKTCQKRCHIIKDLDGEVEFNFIKCKYLTDFLPFQRFPISFYRDLPSVEIHIIEGEHLIQNRHVLVPILYYYQLMFMGGGGV